MAYTVEQVNMLLAKVNTEGELRSLIEQLDVEVTGRVTLLYSGPIGGGASAADVVEAMVAQNEEVRVIDKTEAARFLDIDRNEVLEDTLRRIFADDPLEKGSRANQFLFGATDADGRRIANGAWDIVSEQFVSATTGDVITLTPFTDPMRVFGATELPALLDNPEVTRHQWLRGRTAPLPSPGRIAASPEECAGGPGQPWGRTARRKMPGNDGVHETAPCGSSWCASSGAHRSGQVASWDDWWMGRFSMSGEFFRGSLEGQQGKPVPVWCHRCRWSSHRKRGMGHRFGAVR